MADDKTEIVQVYVGNSSTTLFNPAREVASRIKWTGRVSVENVDTEQKELLWAPAASV